MDELIYIDKTTYKLMKYVYRRQEVKLSEIDDKFKSNGIASTCYLCDIKYGVFRKADGKLTLDSSVLNGNDSFGLMPPGNCYVENRRENSLRWPATTAISLTAVVISIIALIASLHTEIFVHLII